MRFYHLITFVGICKWRKICYNENTHTWESRVAACPEGGCVRKVRLGRTELQVTKTAFGALSIQRFSKVEATKLLRRAYESGINFMKNTI